VQLQEVRPQLKPGDTLDIAGIINPLSSDLSQWNINPADQERLKGFNTFVIETRSQPGRK
jgi:hypothetical protein